MISLRFTDDEIKEAEEGLRKLNLGAKRLGFGKKPAVLVVDMNNDLVYGEDPPYVMAQKIVPYIAKLLAKAREVGVQVFYAALGFSPSAVESGFYFDKFRTEMKGKIMVEGTKGAQIIDELKPQPQDIIIRKKRNSAFFNTDLDFYVKAMGIDTLIITGATLNGCVIGTVADAFARDIRPIVPKECVADRGKFFFEAEMPHLIRIADVVTLDETLQYLSNMKSGAR